MGNHQPPDEGTLGELSLALCEALDDSVTLLEGWITRHCPPRYRGEHLADVAKKRRIVAAVRQRLEAMAKAAKQTGGEDGS
jgi:hypothetical protein